MHVSVLLFLRALARDKVLGVSKRSGIYSPENANRILQPNRPVRQVCRITVNRKQSILLKTQSVLIFANSLKAAWILFVLSVDLSSPSSVPCQPFLKLMLGPIGFPLQILTGLRGCCRVLVLSVILLSSEFGEENGGT